MYKITFVDLEDKHKWLQTRWNLKNKKKEYLHNAKYYFAIQ